MVGKPKNCEVCGKKLNFWNTQRRKYNGKTVCTSCGWKMEKQRIKQDWKTQGEKTDKKLKKASNLFKKLSAGSAIPLLFIIGLVTLPIGIIFWIIGLIIFLKVFSGGETKNHKKKITDSQDKSGGKSDSLIDLEKLKELKDKGVNRGVEKDLLEQAARLAQEKPKKSDWRAGRVQDPKVKKQLQIGCLVMGALLFGIVIYEGLTGNDTKKSTPQPQQKPAISETETDFTHVTRETNEVETKEVETKEAETKETAGLETKPTRETMIGLFKQEALAEWGDNKRMVNYEVKEQTKAYDWVVKQTKYPDIIERAKQEWGNNYRMVKHEYKEQAGAYEWINQQTAYPDIMARAKQEWGNNYRMVKHEYKEQAGAYEWINQQTAYPDIMARAKQEWGNNYRMVKHEYKRQKEKRD